MSEEQQPQRLYVCQHFNERNDDGKTVEEYLTDRYTVADWGYFAGGKIIFFKDEGHCLDFARKFEGIVGVADPEPERPKILDPFQHFRKGK